MLQLESASALDIPLLQKLAEEIWQASYPGIISQEQIDFMLPWMYGTEQLESEMEDPSIQFFLLQEGNKIAGFASLGPTEEDEELHLYKLYLKPELQGKGLGSQALTLLKEVARQRAAARLSLRVNRRNASAIACYQKNGFQIQRQIVSEIGAGFIMDDHWMVALL